jgi:uncharacterized protein
MLSFLIFFGVLGAVFYAFARVFRSRVHTRMSAVEMPAELVAAQHAAAARGAAVRPGPASSPAAVPKPRAAPHFMLIYDVGPDFLQRRAQFRDEHLALAWKASEAGDLVLAGALEEPAEQAFLLFRGSREAALRFAAADPYVKHGLVKGFKVKQWHTVVGAQAAAPVRPKA